VAMTMLTIYLPNNVFSPLHLSDALSGVFSQKKKDALSQVHAVEASEMATQVTSYF
jgi:hypothetical protein